MFGPPSSPPVRVSTEQENELRNMLLPAFGHESPASAKSREAARSKVEVYRDNSASNNQPGFLPTPIPTSEANLQPSSPLPSSPHVNYATERSVVPLQQMLVVRVPVSGEKVTVGRSSKSSNYALRASNRLASRVHASISFNASMNLLMIECLGWNGLVVSVPHNLNNGPSKKTYDVSRSQVLNIEGADGVTLDIHGDKALVEVFNDTQMSDITEDETWSLMGSSPVKHKHDSSDKENRLTVKDNAALPELKLKEPAKAEEINKAQEKQREHELREAKATEEAEAAQKTKDAELAKAAQEAEAAQRAKLAQAAKAAQEAKVAQEGKASEETKAAQEAKEVEEAKKLPEIAKIEESNTKKVEVSEAEHEYRSIEGSRASKTRSRASSRAASEEPEVHSGRKMRRQHEPLTDDQRAEFENVIANLIAFSRSSAVPLSAVRKSNTALHNMPKSQVMAIIKGIPCVGIIEGAVEDTTARKADDEYYYIPDKDSNEERRRAVQGTRGHRSLRNCRKTSKQYYYRPLQLD